MTDHPDVDVTIRDWILIGAEVAPADFVDETLRPIPRMRQRRSWRIALDPLTRPAASVLMAAATVAIAVVALGAFGLASGGGRLGGGSSPTPSKPTFQMTISAFADAGSYTSDPAAGLDYCLHASDGAWRFQYVGGQPAINIDMLVGSDAAGAGGAGHVAAEITFDDQTLHIDPSDLRGGDFPLGRSTASVQVRTGPGSITFVMTATTPDRSTGYDGAPVQVDLTVVCPN
jgi:hypothetical protein